MEGANTLFDTVDALFGTVDRKGVGNEEGANLLLLPPLWSALGVQFFLLPTHSRSYLEKDMSKNKKQKTTYPV